MFLCQCGTGLGRPKKCAGDGTFNTDRFSSLDPKGNRAMPRFYIQFRNGNTISEDDEGIDLPGLEQAHAMARASARELIGDAIATGSQTIVDEVIITEQDGKKLLSFSGK